MKHTFLIACILCLHSISFAQDRVITRTATVRFYSKAPMEDIEASNHSVISVLDKTTGQIEFSALLKGFSFEKALMQEHFNENYVESDQYPKAAFKGRISDLSKVNFSKDGIYTIPVTGSFSLHGITKELTTNAMLSIQKGAIEGNASFNIVLDDYKISIPSLVKDKIAKSVKITIKAQYQAL